MSHDETADGGERITVKEYAGHAGYWPDGSSPSRAGRKAAEWCRREGVPTGEAEEGGRRVKTFPEAALRDVFDVPPDTPPYRESPFC